MYRSQPGEECWQGKGVPGRGNTISRIKECSGVKHGMWNKGRVEREDKVEMNFKTDIRYKIDI